MKRLLENYATIEEHVSLKKYNTYRVEGQARYLVSPNSITDLLNQTLQPRSLNFKR